MKKYLIFMIILLVTAVTMSFAEKGPRISFISDHHDFGSVLQGKTVTIHSFLRTREQKTFGLRRLRHRVAAQQPLSVPML